MIYKKYDNLRCYAAANIMVLFLMRLYMAILFLPLLIFVLIYLAFLLIKEILEKSSELIGEAVTSFKENFIPSWSGKDLKND